VEGRRGSNSAGASQSRCQDQGQGDRRVIPHRATHCSWSFFVFCMASASTQFRVPCVVCVISHACDMQTNAPQAHVPIFGYSEVQHYRLAVAVLHWCQNWGSYLQHQGRWACMWPGRAGGLGAARPRSGAWGGWCCHQLYEDVPMATEVLADAAAPVSSNQKPKGQAGQEHRAPSTRQAPTKNAKANASAPSCQCMAVTKQKTAC
jgi:hypothetical protein